MFTPYVPNLYYLMDVQKPTPYDMLRAVQFSPPNTTALWR